jgi:hypothetical protein
MIYPDMIFGLFYGVMSLAMGHFWARVIYIPLVTLIIYRLNNWLKKYDNEVIKEKADIKQLEANKIEIIDINEVELEANKVEVNFVASSKTFWAYSDSDNLIIDENIMAKFTFIEEDVSDEEFWADNNSKRKELISRDGDKFQYKCYGQIIRIKPTIIDCGELRLSSGNWIKEKEAIGKYVYFEVKELNLEAE